MSRRMLGLLLGLSVFCSPSAFADRGVPPPKTKVDPPKVEAAKQIVQANVVIKREELPKLYQGADAVIVIPAKFAPAVKNARSELPVIDGGGDDSSRWHPLFAGICLTLAAVSAGLLWRGRPGVRIAAGSAAALLLLAGVWALTSNDAAADLIIPGRNRPRPPATVFIEYVQDGDTVTIMLPPGPGR